MTSRRPPPAPDDAWAYFFDLDGTLVDLEPAPEDVRVDGDLRALLDGLHRTAGGAVALISGRSLADLDRLFAPARWPAAGQHGTERRDAAGRVTRHDLAPERLAEARERLRAAAERHPGLRLEDKGLTLALHYRGAPRLASHAHRLAAAALADLGPDFRAQTGKRIVELKPAGHDKGQAVLAFMREPPFAGRVSVFVGDDVTDEWGFAAVNELGGHTVKVGPGRTAARWRLRDVAAVRAWLRAR